MEQGENRGHGVKRRGEGWSARGHGLGAPHHLCWRGPADCPYDSVPLSSERTLGTSSEAWVLRQVSKRSGAALDGALGRRPFLSQPKCSRGRCRGYWDCPPEAPSTSVQPPLAWPTQGPWEPPAASGAPGSSQPLQRPGPVS